MYILILISVKFHVGHRLGFLTCALVFFTDRSLLTMIPVSWKFFQKVIEILRLLLFMYFIFVHSNNHPFLGRKIYLHKQHNTILYLFIPCIISLIPYFQVPKHFNITLSWLIPFSYMIYQLLLTISIWDLLNYLFLFLDLSTFDVCLF